MVCGVLNLTSCNVPRVLTTETLRKLEEDPVTLLLPGGARLSTLGGGNSVVQEAFNEHFRLLMQEV